MNFPPLRHLIALIIVFAPIFVHAQDSTSIIKDLDKKTLGIASSFKFNDHLGIYQVNLNDTTFELIALDDKMQILWRNQFKGYGVGCGKFKGNILAIADSGYSSKHWFINPYYAYSIDPRSGKTILQKEIFRQHPEHEEIATPVFTTDGSDFSLIVRQTDRKLNMFSSFKDNTEDVTAVGLSENLEPVYLKPKFPDETFVCMTANRHGDLFVLTTINNNTLVARRYAHGSTERSEPLLLTCDSLADLDLARGYNALTASEEDVNVLFVALAHYNHNDDRELYVGKFDFSSKTTKTATEAFTGKYIRTIEKNYVPVNTSFGTPNIGGQKKELTVRYFKEHNGKLVAVMSETYFVTIPSLNVTTYYAGALIINCYDGDLKKQFQQLMPTYTSSSDLFNTGFRDELTSGFRFEDNALKIVSNTSEPDNHPAYGQLDLSTGKWLKLGQLMADDKYNSDEHILWFNDTFIVPSLRRVVLGHKHNIDLLLYSY